MIFPAIHSVEQKHAGIAVAAVLNTSNQYRQSWEIIIIILRDFPLLQFVMHR